jgi:P27 family predicted phage terminase small subunit
MRGRKPKSTAIQIVEGDPRRLGKNKLQAKAAREPKATDELPKCPAYLRKNQRARAAWNFWRAELQKMHMDRRPDCHMLEGAVIAYAETVACFELVEKQGRVIPRRARDAAGNWVVVGMVAHPAVRQRNQALLIMRAFCSEFGLSPISRTRLSVEAPDDEDDDLMKLLSQPRTNRRVFPGMGEAG